MIRAEEIVVLHAIHWARSGIVSIVRSMIDRMRTPDVVNHVVFFEADKQTVASFSKICETATSLGASRSFAEGLWRYRRLLREMAPNVLHAHSLQPFVWGAMFSGSQTKLINTVHNEYPYFDDDGARARVKRMVHKSFNRWTGVKTVAVSRAVFRRLPMLGAAPADRALIENGIPVDVSLELKSEMQTARDNFGVSKEDLLVLTVGRLDPQKGFDVLIKAFASVSSCESRARLVIVGDGPERDGLRELVEGLGLSGRVIFAGYQHEPERLFSCADVYVSSSRYEGFGLALLEAMAWGIPVIATRVGVAEDVITEGETGLLVDANNERALGDGLLRLLANANLRVKMGKSGSEVVRNSWSVDRTADAYVGLYRSVMGRPTVFGEKYKVSNGM